MFKTIRNDNTGVIHIAYGVNQPITHCGAVNSYSEEITIHRYDSRALRNAAVTCQNCLRMLAATNRGNKEVNMSEIVMPGAPVTPLLAVDALMLHNGKLTVIERLCNPYGLAWPGGFVDVGESVETAVLREIFEETNLEADIVELIGVYSDPNRDPRGHVVSVAFLCRSTGRRTPMAKDDAKSIGFHTIQNSLKLGLEFDHKQMLLDALSSTSLDRRKP